MTVDELLGRKEGDQLWMEHSEKAEELGLIKLMT